MRTLTAAGVLLTGVSILLAVTTTSFTSALGIGVSTSPAAARPRVKRNARPAAAARVTAPRRYVGRRNANRCGAGDGCNESSLS